MLKTKAALITAFVIASSSVAMAAPRTASVSVSARADFSIQTRRPAPVPTPVVIRDHRYEEPAPVPVVRDHRFDQTYYHDNQWIPTAQPSRDQWALLGTENQRIDNSGMTFNVGANTGLTSQIVLKSTAGKARIDAITVNFADGRAQTFQVNRYVGDQGTVNLAASDNYTLDLGTSRRVTSIVVDGSNAVGSSFSVYAL